MNNFVLFLIIFPLYTSSLQVYLKENSTNIVENGTNEFPYKSLEKMINILNEKNDQSFEIWIESDFYCNATVFIGKKSSFLFK